VRATAWSLGDGKSALGAFVPHDDVVAREHELARIDGALTAREREMLQRLADGSSNRELAAALHLSETTVSHHVASALKKEVIWSAGRDIDVTCGCIPEQSSLQ
jgi:FixJ family two-component response regulator